MESPTTLDPTLLLEYAASDDLVSFRKAVEMDFRTIDVASKWYGRWSSQMGFQERTPLMVAALYGSVSVLEYILSFETTFPGTIHVNRRCGSDNSSALHLAVSGASPVYFKIVKLLLDAKADVSLLDSSGRTPIHVVPRQKPCLGKMKSAVELALGGGHGYFDGLEGEIPTSTPSLVNPKQQKVTSPGAGGLGLGEKKEYPVDATLPDIKSGVCGTDEFRMYTFKVKPCSRAYSHDWTECPFVHPGENARRRDPRKYHYSCVPCPEFRKGSCRNGDACEYAHGVFESWLHPAQYRTRLCKDETGCNRRVCFFAHKTEELRPLYNSVVSSPRSPANLPSLDLSSAAAMLMNQQTPLSPSSSSALAAAVWLNQNTGTPTSQLPSSRLKSAMNARDMDYEFDLLGLDGSAQKQVQNQNFIDEIGNLSSRSMNMDYGVDFFGSPESNPLSPLTNHSLKQSPSLSQFQSPPSSIQKQLLSNYNNGGGNIPSSPSTRSSSPSFGLDHKLASAIINSRASSFAKRSQSFVDRGVGNRQVIGSTQSQANSDWGSPSGKLDWGIQGEELNKLRKSASFAFRKNEKVIPASQLDDEPDVSWVQSIVKDGPMFENGYVEDEREKMQRNQQQMMMLMMMNKKKQFHLNSGAGEFHPGDSFASWNPDQIQIHLDQEQMVA